MEERSVAKRGTVWRQAPSLSKRGSIERPSSSPPGLARRSLNRGSVQLSPGTETNRVSSKKAPQSARRTSVQQITDAFPQAPPETIMELREVFKLADTDGGGSIGSEELKGLLDQVGLKVSREDFNKLMAEIDEDGSGEVDLFEFVTMMTRKVEMDASEEQLNRAFRIFAEDSPPGTISMDNVKRMVADFGPKHGFSEAQGNKLLRDLEAELKTLGAQFSTTHVNEDGTEQRLFRYPEYIPLMLAANNQSAATQRRTHHGPQVPGGSTSMTSNRGSVSGRPTIRRSITRQGTKRGSQLS